MAADEQGVEEEWGNPAEEDEDNEDEEPAAKETEAPPVATLLFERDATLDAVRASGAALEFASAELRTDREIVLAAINQCPAALRHAGAALRADKEVVAAACALRGTALQHASEECRGCREIVQAALAQDPCALEFTASELRSDAEVVAAAVGNRGWSLQHASPELRSDRQFVLTLMRASVGGRALRYVSERLRDDGQVVTAAVRTYGLALEAASWRLRSDYETVLAAVNQQGTALQFAAPELRDDHRIVLDAVIQNRAAYRFASDRLHNDPDALAARGLGAGDAAGLKTGPQAAPPEVEYSPDGFVEFKRPRTPAWPVVLSVPHGGYMKPKEVPDRSSGCLEPDWKTWELSEEVWNAFGFETTGAPAMVRMKLHRSKSDVNRSRAKSCDDDSPAAVAWDAYHGWLTEACRTCVARYGFCLLLDLHGQSHRRLVTELGYLVTTDDLLLYDCVLDQSTRPTSVDALLRGLPPRSRPGGLANLIRGPQSLASYLERRGFPCTPSPKNPEPVKAIPLHAFRAAQAEAAQKADVTAANGPPAMDAGAVTYFWGAYTVRRYGAPDTVPEDADPLPEEDRASWGQRVASIQVETSWLGVRSEIVERRFFGEHLRWATEQVLRNWMGWELEADARG